MTWYNVFINGPLSDRLRDWIFQEMRQTVDDVHPDVEIKQFFVGPNSSSFMINVPTGGGSYSSQNSYMTSLRSYLNEQFVYYENTGVE